jgi:hypothetical protein
MLNQKQKRKRFSDFDLTNALFYTGICEPEIWNLDFPLKEPGDFFEEKLNRLDAFDRGRSERAKLLIADAFFEEAVQSYKNKIRIFKDVKIYGESISGTIDYVVSERCLVSMVPYYLCVAKAERDDFDKGLAQCLVQMQTMAELNAKENKNIDIYGIVTNGRQWQFYKKDTEGAFYESEDYGISNAPRLLGILDLIFAACAANLDK